MSTIIRYRKNLPNNIKIKEGIILDLKNPNAIPMKSPINGSQQKRANQYVYFLTMSFQDSIFSKEAPSFFNQYGFPILPIK